MASPRVELTAATYNVRAAIGPGPFPDAWWRHVDADRLRHIGEVIRELRADLVALQEVALMTVDGVVSDQSRELAQITGMDVRYGAVGHFPIVDRGSGDTIGASFWGNAVLSRHPIRTSRVTGLPPAGDDDLVEPAGSGRQLAGVRYADSPVGTREPRCMLVCDVELEERTLHFLSTHLTHVGSGQRRGQAEALAAALAELDGTAILAGDLNAAIQSDDLAPLRDGLLDAFTVTGVPPGDAARRSCGPRAIDHLLVRGATAADCRVVREAGDASDHWPVVATVAL